MRASFYSFGSVDFHQVSASGDSAWAKERFDLVFLNAVYEHLLPDERPTVLRSVWASLRRGGALVVTQTPHRWFPVETHTSGLPLINWMPDRLAHRTIRRFSRRVTRDASWEKLLRAGVRGASVSEIVTQIRSVDADATLLPTISIASTWAGIWYAAKSVRLQKVRNPIARLVIRLIASFVRLTSLPFAPYVNIAISKGRLDLEGRPSGSGD
jgi:hypothetical protein